LLHGWAPLCHEGNESIVKPTLCSHRCHQHHHSCEQRDAWPGAYAKIGTTHCPSQAHGCILPGSDAKVQRPCRSRWGTGKPERTRPEYISMHAMLESKPLHHIE
jgi:hypothetical protein